MYPGKQEHLSPGVDILDGDRPVLRRQEQTIAHFLYLCREVGACLDEGLKNRSKPSLPACRKERIARTAPTPLGRQVQIDITKRRTLAVSPRCVDAKCEPECVLSRTVTRSPFEDVRNVLHEIPRSVCPNQVAIEELPCLRANPARSLLSMPRQVTVGERHARAQTARQTKIASKLYPGRSRAAHFQAANRNLVAAMDGDAEFEKSMDALIPGIRGALVGPRGGISRKSPSTDWTWHHAIEEGVMQLIPRVQHEELSTLMHLAGGIGGFALWG